MKKLAIIGASYLQLPLIEKAKEMGLETHVFAWKAGAIGEKAADFFYPISITEKDKILSKCKEIGINGVCSIASDLAIITVNYIANHLNLCGNSMNSTYKSTNKYEMRQAFAVNGDPSPQSIKISSNTDLSSLIINYPVIVKPTDRSGSRGICKVWNFQMLQRAIPFAISESFEKKALIEEFVMGKEYSVECISFHGTHHFLALTEKFTTGEPHYIETAHVEPAIVDKDILKKIKRVVLKALDSLEIKNGASHTEIKINESGNIKIIEIGARMGGDCIGSDLVRYSTGIDFVKEVIEVSLGNAPDLSPKSKPIGVKSVFLYSRKDLDELESIQKEEPERIIKIVDFHPELIGTTTDSSNRAGCYILKLK